MKKRTDEPRTSDTAQTMRYLSLVGHLGLVMIVSIGGWLLLGLFLDRWLETGAVFTIICIFLGIGSGFFGVYRIIGSLELPKREIPKKGFYVEGKSGIYKRHKGDSGNGIDTDSGAT